MRKVTILDGGMGRELERRGAPFKQPEWSALAMMEAPDIVKEVHKAYIDAGSEIITTNSYALVPFHIGETCFKERGAALAELSATVARQAINETGKDYVQVAGSVAPLFGSYRADMYQPERVAEIATPLITALNPHIDIWLNETQSLIAESVAIKALVDSIDSDHKPYWVSFTLEDSEATEQPLLRSGETVRAAVQSMTQAGVDAILFNCSQPEIIAEAIEVTRQELSHYAKTINIGAYANAFPPQPKNATANDGLDELRADLTPVTYLQSAQKWQELGADLIGGCCGIGPDHIRVLSETLTR